MRTSRISKDTSSLINASALPPIRRTRASLSRFAHNMAPKEEEETPIDIEDSVPGPRKRKREVVVRSTENLSVRKAIKVETEIEERGPPSLAKGRKALRPTRQVKKEDAGEVEQQNPLSSVKERKVRKPARQVKNEDTGEVEIHPPNDWAEVYEVVKEMRTQGSAQNAAVDTMGCERLAQADVPPKVKRFHTLIALMLSSQTKDTTNAGAMNRLFTELPPHAPGAPGGLNLENILAVDPKLLNELIWAVGFHNNKTKYIKATAEILRDTWNSDIPDTIEGLMSLPGVGPKMGYLCLSAAWGRTEGIGVDVHVHRITNLWGWNKTKGPEDTRLALQAWLPRDKWHEINWLLVGLGQTICLPVGRKCGDCELGLRGLCKSAERSKVALGRKVKAEKIKTDEDGNVLEKVETIKLEQISQEIPINAAPMQRHLRIKEEAVEAKDAILEGDFDNSSQSAVNETSKYF